MRAGHKRISLAAVAVAIGIAVTASATGSAATAGAENSRGGPTVLRERLSGYQEDPAVVSSAGTAEVRLTIDETQQQISYVLSYRALEGTVTQAHIHFGGRAQSGGISVFLCTNAGNGPAGTQACPAAPGTVTGVLRAADVIGPAGQGIAAGQFDEFVRAIRANVTYVNVHSSLFPGGELRAQLQHRH